MKSGKTSPQSYAIKRHDPATPTHAPSSSGLFDTLPTWLADPVHAYASWLAGQELRDSTRKVYTAMFGRFCQWLKTRNQGLDEITAEDIGDFLDSVNPNLPKTRKARSNRGRQRQQYVRLLEKVFIHLGGLGFAGGNPGQVAARRRLGAGRDASTRFLTQEERQGLIRLIQTRLDEISEDQTGQWMQMRDLAMVSAMLGGGLKVGHVGRVSLNCIDVAEGTIDLSLPGSAHRARLLDFAIPPIRAWLSVQARRHERPLPRDWKAFEADRSSGFGRHARTRALSASSIHRRTQQILAQAGITGERACAQTLRNTYAAMLIEGGASNAHLVDCLGLNMARTAQRLREAYALARAANSRFH